MSLTPAQRNTLLTAIKADPTARGFRTAGNAYSLLAWCNEASSTDAWRTAVAALDLYGALTISTYDSLPGGRRDAFRMILDFAPFDASKTANRNGLADTFATGGGYADNAQAAKILTACVEKATRAQAAIGGTTPAAVAGVTALRRAFTDLVTSDEVNWLVAAA